ncbi:MAG: lipoprotein [Gammaproteobacteria bacterium]|nr:lipoprotein [Gammaproteobacteria bacterium]
MRKLACTALIGVLVLGLWGCGQKGPLRRPQQTYLAPSTAQQTIAYI